MASWLQLFTNPHRLAALLLSIATCLLTLTTLPPSSVIYLIRADYSLDTNDAITSTTWFGNFGYCTSDAIDEILSYKHSDIKCSDALIHGYSVESALPQDGTRAPSALEGPPALLSTILTRGAGVLNPLAIALCLVGVAAYRSILRRPGGWWKYAAAMGASFLGLLLSGVAFVFEHALQAYIAGGSSSSPATSDAATAAAFTTTFTTTRTTTTTTTGPVYHAVVASLLVQLAASVVGFYSCIGGKYQCEGGRRLEDEESSGTTMTMKMTMTTETPEQGVIGLDSSPLDEKRLL